MLVLPAASSVSSPVSELTQRLILVIATPLETAELTASAVSSCGQFLLAFAVLIYAVYLVA